jgi:formylglycine-generating enzyme required for sulfatase activity
MNSKTWQRVQDLYTRAIEVPAQDREAWLAAELRNETPDVAVELRRMLASHDKRTPEPPDAARLAAATTTTSDPLIGRELGGWIVERRIDEGGIGIVYAARAAHGSRKAAIKVLKSNVSISSLLIERFRREANAASKLVHPAIATIYGFGQEGGVPYIAMELIDGRPLSAYIDDLRSGSGDTPRGPLDLLKLSECVDLVVRIADALSFSHESGILHRDIKPHNVLIDAEGRPHVVDFGLARDLAATSDSVTSAGMGTPHYMSPEQALAQRNRIDHRTDVYSLGVVLYEVLTLHRPFDGATQHDVWFKILHSEPPSIRVWNPSVPKALILICMQAMRREVDGRYASMAEFAEDLRRYQRGESVRAQPESWTRRVQREIKKTRTISAAAVTVLLGGVVGGGLMFEGIARARAEALRPKLAVHLDSGASANVFLQLVRDAQFQEPTSLGSTHDGGLEFRADVGLARVTIRGQDGALAECDRQLASETEEEIVARPRRIEELGDDWVFVPGGEVEIRAPLDPTAKQRVRVAGYWLERSCVTNATYSQFLRETNRPAPSGWPEGVLDDPSRAGRADWPLLPATGMNWKDARDCCEWSGARLPDASEWYLAALTAEDALARLAASEPDSLVLGRPQVVTDRSWPAYLAAVRPAREGAPELGELRLRHMFGNVQQWTSTPRWQARDGHIEVDLDMRVTGGAPWHFPAAAVVKSGATSFACGFATGDSPEIGFRRARSATP